MPTNQIVMLFLHLRDFSGRSKWPTLLRLGRIPNAVRSLTFNGYVTFITVKCQ